jgi:elongation factor P
MMATDLKTGVVYKEDNAPLLVLRYAHIKSARGGANVKVKVRNLINGSVLEKGYDGSSRVEDADVRRKNAQYLYKEGSNYVFMDPTTYEQLYISDEVIEDQSKFLVEGDTVQVVFFEENPISIELAITMVFEVTYTEPGFRGNTVTNVLKDATLNNGAVVKVPPFIKIGDKVKIDTRSAEYISKA